jgi:dienelactone hydrolase
MSPTFRGENGNPGYYELFFGEVDDAARAAIMWLSQQSYVDETQMYTFGTSMGGEISALLSLYNDLAICFGGSCGAFFGRSERFGPESMYNAPVPFDPEDQDEHNLSTFCLFFEILSVIMPLKLGVLGVYKAKKVAGTM